MSSINIETLAFDIWEWIDPSIVGVYLLGSFLLGIFSYKLFKQQQTTEEGYFLAGRNVPAWVGGTSYAVTCMNSDVAPAYCGMAAVVGLPVAWFYMSRFGFGLMLSALLFSIRWRQLGISTGPEFIRLRFGGYGSTFVRGYSSIFSVMIGMVPWIGAGLLGVHMIFNPVFGIDTIADKIPFLDGKGVTLVITLPVLMAYVWVSGFAGVLVTDVIQTIIIILANVILMLAVLWHIGGPNELGTQIMNAHPEEYGDILGVLPAIGHTVFGPIVVMAWMAVSTIGYGGGVGTDGQRIFACRNVKEAAKVGIWGEIMLFIMLLVLTLPTLGALVNHPELYHATPAQREEVYGILLKDYLPVGLLGIALAALLASVMSTIDSHLNYGSQTLVNDVYKPLVKGNVSEKETLWIGRILMCVIMAAAVIVTYFFNSLIGIAIILGGMFGSTAAFGWAQWWWWRINLWSWVTATIGGPIVYFGLGYALKQWSWWEAQLALGESAAQGMAMLQAVIAMVLTTSMWVIVTFFTKPEKTDVLKKFYLQARPLGLWGPVIEELQKDGYNVKPQKNLIISGACVSFVGFAAVACGVMGISKLYVGLYISGIFLFIAMAVLGFLFKRLFNWHVDRMLIDPITNREEVSEIAEKTITI